MTARPAPPSAALAWPGTSGRTCRSAPGLAKSAERAGIGRAPRPSRSSPTTRPPGADARPAAGHRCVPRSAGGAWRRAHRRPRLVPDQPVRKRTRTSGCARSTRWRPSCGWRALRRPTVNVHIGSHRGQGRADGHRSLAAGLREVFARVPPSATWTAPGARELGRCGRRHRLHASRTWPTSRTQSAGPASTSTGSVSASTPRICGAPATPSTTRMWSARSSNGRPRARARRLRTVHLNDLKAPRGRCAIATSTSAPAASARPGCAHG